MNKIIISLFLLLTTYSQGHAQEKLTPREILDRTSEKMMAKGGVSANFETTIFQGTTPQDNITGSIDMLGEKYVLKTSAICTWYNGKDQWNLIQDNKEVTLVEPTPDELQVASPNAFLTIYKEGFNLSTQKAELRGRNIYDISLKPKKRKQEPSVIIISVDQETFYPMCIRVRNQGNWTRFSINDLKVGANLTDSHFNYPAQAYPEYELIDMR